jgi:hypothetical protein
MLRIDGMGLPHLNDERVAGLTAIKRAIGEIL